MSTAGRPLRADAQRNRARILAAAEAVFAEHGAAASTDEVAARAGVAIGTVFRHFPTKDDLLRAIMKDLLEQVVERATTLAVQGDPATGLFAFFSWLVAQAAARKTVVDLLARGGTAVQVGPPLLGLRDAVQTLLTRAQAAGGTRAEVRIDEVLALLASTCQGAVQAGWDADLQHRTLDVIFAGLRPSGSVIP